MATDTTIHPKRTEHTPHTTTTYEKFPFDRLLLMSTTPLGATSTSKIKVQMGIHTPSQPSVLNANTNVQNSAAAESACTHWHNACWRLLRVLGGTHVAALLGSALETTVAELRGGVDEAEGDLLAGSNGGVGAQVLAEGDDTLLRADNATLDHDPVVLDHTIVGETTHGCDALLSKVGRGGSVVLLALLANAVDLLVELGTVMVTVLTRSGHSVRKTARVPRTNASNLAQTTVGLTGKACGTPTGGNTFVTSTTAGTEDVDALVLGEDVGESNLLLEEGAGESDLVSHGSAVDLDLHDVGLLLAKLGDGLDVGVGDDADALAELDHALVLGLEFLLALFGLVLLGVAGESLGLSAGNPTLVEAAAGLLAKVLGPHGVEGAEALGGLDVADNANDVHGGSLDDGHSLDNLLLVELGTELVDGTGDVGHTGLVTHESSEVGLLGGIIDREGTDVATVVLGALARQETKVSVAGSLELTVGHL